MSLLAELILAVYGDESSWALSTVESACQDDEFEGVEVDEETWVTHKEGPKKNVTSYGSRTRAHGVHGCMVH